MSGEKWFRCVLQEEVNAKCGIRNAELLRDFCSLFLAVSPVVNSGGAFGEFAFVVLYRQSDCAFRWARGAVLRGNHKRGEESPTASAVSPPL